MCRVRGMQGASELAVPKSLMVQLVAAPGATLGSVNRLAPATRDWGTRFAVPEPLGFGVKWGKHMPCHPHRV
jgi:hypothetical protein